MSHRCRYRVRIKVRGKHKAFFTTAASSKEAAQRVRNGRVVSVRKA